MQDAAALFTKVMKGGFSEDHLQPVHKARYCDGVGPSNTQAQKADHYLLYGRTEMRSGQCASSRQDTDYAGAG
jgi:hypothetical protein